MLLAEVIETQRQRLELANIPSGWLIFVFIGVVLAACGLALWLYRRERRAGASRALRLLLGGVRCLILLGLAAIWLRPVIATFDIRSITARVVVLTDVSSSMSVTDGSSGTEEANISRLARVQSLLARDDSAWLQRLAARNDLALFAFGEKTASLETDLLSGAAASAAETRPGLTPLALATLTEPNALQSRTDLGAALATVADEVGEAPLAGVIVITDGQLNAGLNAEDTAALARRLKAPLYTVGAGSPEEPPNLRVTSVSAPPTAPRGDPFELRVEVAANGVGVQDADVIISQTLAGGGDETTLERRRVPVGGDTTPAPLLVSINPPAAGEFVLRARVEPAEGEAILQDNARETTVQVLDEKLRVLIIAGRPSYDYRFVARLLERDKTIDASCWLQSADAQALRDGDTQLTELPTRPEELFAYDCILLIDPNPTDLTAPWAATVRRFVDELGGGVLLEAGGQFTSRFLRDAKVQDIVGLLPITPDPEADVQLSEQGTFRTHATPLELPQESRAHPLIALATEPALNLEIWKSLPGAMWYLPVLKPKPLAAVLLQPAGATARRDSAPVLFAVQPFGSGRAAFLAFDNTWRWRGTAEPYFNRFWVQLVRYLSQARRESISKRGTITLDRDNLNVGDYIRVEARVLDPSFTPSTEPQIEAQFEIAGESRTLVMPAIPGRDGWFAGNILIDRDGLALIRIPLTPDPARPATQPADQALIKRFRVQQPDLEMRALRRREDVLRLLAEQTGGQYFPLERAENLPDLIESAAQERVTPGPAHDLWDRAWVLATLAALLAFEWTLRRRNHLL